MFHEPVATIIRDHARTHLRDYFDQVNAQFTDRVALVLPKSFETASLVGGVAGASRETLPAFALDVYDKRAAEDAADIWTYLYDARFLGLVGGQSSSSVEKATKRYAAAMEMFVRQHQHPMTVVGNTQPFLIAEFLHVRTSFFGAAQVSEQDIAYWIDGFQIDATITVSENGPSQHS